MRLIKNKKGFTLIEMLIVLVIVSLLSLLIIPNIATTTDKVDKEAEYALTQVIQSQASLYKLEKGTFPTMEQLKSAKYITEEQETKANAWGISLSDE